MTKKHLKSQNKTVIKNNSAQLNYIKWNFVNQNKVVLTEINLCQVSNKTKQNEVPNQLTLRKGDSTAWADLSGENLKETGYFLRTVKAAKTWWRGESPFLALGAEKTTRRGTVNSI